MSPITLENALAFILTTASEDDLARFDATARQRSVVNAAARADLVEEGLTVRIDHLRNKYLNGLRGVVHSIDRPRAGRPTAIIRLDAASAKVAKAWEPTLAGNASHCDIRISLTCCFPE
ncbi:hypothetical protein [Embleya sp. MST-111070]|uniref:hypothetical protein n=1 Tax=Embleya sp. MST-111070 TaxID=3398231 RepID=UPI003F732EB4